GNRPAAIARTKPVCEVHDHSGEEAGFSEPQQEAGGVELCGTIHKASHDRDYSPGDHDPCNPLPRAPAFYDDGSWYLKQNVGQVKHADAQAVHAITEAQVGAHSEIGEGNVGAIDVVHDVDEENERKQAIRNSSSCSSANFW